MIGIFSNLIKIINKHFVWVVFGIYASGFFVWNVYLSHFGFFEYNLIQIRFLSAGLLWWLPIILVILIEVSISRIINSTRKKLQELVGFFFGVLVGLWFISLPLFLFPLIPQYFGGAEPIPTSIIGTPDQIGFLKNFDIPSADNAGKASVQTFPICLIYQNDQYVLFLTTTLTGTSTDTLGNINNVYKSRALSLAKSEYIGFQAVGDEYARSQCSASEAFLAVR